MKRSKKRVYVFACRKKTKQAATYSAKFKVLLAVFLKIKIFWDVTPC